MIWCGFDESMRSGIVTFATGVSRAIFDKAKERGVRLSEQLIRERYELRVLEEMAECCFQREPIENSSERLKLKAFIGMVSIARHFIENVALDQLSDQDAPSFFSDAHSLASQIKLFEEAYERELQDLTHEEKVGAALRQIFELQSVAPGVPE